MNVTATFKHLEHTDALDEIIQKKSKKLEKHFRNDCDLKWVCWVDKREHHAEVIVKNGQNDYMAKAHSDDMYKSIDQVIHKIENQL